MALPAVEGYSELEEIGAGGFATVYRARQVRLDRQVALKVLRAKDLDEATVRRFERECHAMGDLSWHPNVVGVFDSGVNAEGHPWLAMEYMSRGSIADRMRKSGPLAWSEVVDIGVQVAGALGAVHAAGRIHRDVKPENLLVGPFGEVKLADFGIAVVSDATSATAAQFTPGFVSTEVLQGKSPDERSDVYSLGATLHALIAGHSPFATVKGEPVAALLMRAIQGERPRLEDVPDDLADLIVSCLDTEPDQRPQTAAALGLALQGIQRAHGLPVTVLRITAESDADTSAAEAVDPSATVVGAVPSTGGDASSTIVGSLPSTGEDASSTIVGRVPTGPPVSPPPPPPQAPRPAPPPPQRPPPPVAPAATAAPNKGRTVALAVGGGAVALVAVIAAVVVLGGGDESGSGGTTTSSSVPATVVESEAEVVATIEVGAGPRDLAVSPNARDVWVANGIDGTVSRIAVSSDEVLATVDVGAGPADIAVTEDLTWVANLDGGNLTAIRVASNEVAATVPVDGDPADVLAIEDFVWASTSTPSALQEIDISDLQNPLPLRTARIGGLTSGMTSGETGFWVGRNDRNSVAKVTYDEFEVTDVDAGAGVFDVAADATRVYVSNSTDGTVTIIEEATGEVEATVDVGETALGLALAEDGVWVVSGATTVSRIEDLEVVETVEAGVGLLDVVSIGNDLWLSDEVSDEVLRLRLGGR